MNSLMKKLKKPAQTRWSMLGGILLIGTFLAAPNTMLHARIQAQTENGKVVGIEMVHIQVDGLACPFCAFNIEKRLIQLEGVSGADQIHVNIPDGLVSLHWKAGVGFDPEDVNEQVRRAGFTPKRIELVVSGSVESPGRMHMSAGTDSPITIIAGKESTEARRYAALESEVTSSETPIHIRVRGTIRKKKDSWKLVLQEWEPL